MKRLILAIILALLPQTVKAIDPIPYWFYYPQEKFDSKFKDDEVCGHVDDNYAIQAYNKVFENECICPSRNDTFIVQGVFSRWYSCSFINLKFFGLLDPSYFKSCLFFGDEFYKVDWDGAIFQDCIFLSCGFTKVQIHGATFSNCYFVNSPLETPYKDKNTTFDNCHFINDSLGVEEYLGITLGWYDQFYQE